MQNKLPKLYMAGGKRHEIEEWRNKKLQPVSVSASLYSQKDVFRQDQRARPVVVLPE